MSNPAGFNETLKLLECCIEIFGHPPLSHASVAAYLEAIGSKDWPQIARRFSDWLKVENRFPTPADIRRAIVQTEQGEAS